MFFRENIRKSLSYVMLPAMIIYTVLPCTSYGSVIPYAQGKDKNDNLTGNESSYNTLAEEARTLNNKASKESKLTLKGDEQKSPSSSGAANYTMGIGAEVNPQTGQLDITFNDIKLPGMSEDTALSLGISNGGGNNGIYGMVAGWKFSLDYIDISTHKLYMSGSQNYTIDSSFYSYDSDNNRYYSGLRYCTNKGIKFEDKKTNISLPYEKDLNLSYRCILSMSKGVNEYFDSSGKLICLDDRFGNHIIYTYNNGASSPYQAKLTGIRDSFGQNIAITYKGYLITITMPDGRSASYDFSKSNSISVKGLNGRNGYLYINGNNKVTKIEYPTGGYTQYVYSSNALPYTVKGKLSYFDGIIQVIQHSNSGPDIVTKYNYSVDSGHSFAGAGICNYSSDNDALIQSNANSYTYTTEITSVRSKECGGTVKTLATYNFLHLPLNSIVESDGKILARTKTTYMGAPRGTFPGYNQLSSNYNLPSEVISTTYASASNTNSAGFVRETKVKTSYDDYGRSTAVLKYNNGKETSSTRTDYYSGAYDNIKSQSVYDNIDKTTARVSSTLSPDGKYIASSTASIDKRNTSTKTTSTVLDSCGRVTSSTISTSGGMQKNYASSSTVRTSYAMNGNELNGKTLSVITTDELGNSSSKEIDISSGNVLSETDARGNRVNYTYSDNGLIVRKSYPDGSWEQTDSSDPNKVVTSSSNGLSKTDILDGFGRVIEESDNFGRKTSITYNELGKPSSQTDMFGHTINYTYDYQGRAVRAQDYLNNVKEYVYDDGAQTVTEKINGISVSESESDDNGNLKSQRSFLSKNETQEQYIYNGKNLEIASSLSVGEDKDIASSFSDYDIDGKLIKATVRTKDGTNGTSEYALSLFGDMIEKNTTFRGVSPGVEKGAGVLISETKEYNSIGKLTSLTNQIGQKITYTYDAGGNLASMTDFAGNTFTYTYDNMNRMVTMTGPEYTVNNEYYGIGGGSEGKLKSRSLTENGTLADKISYAYDDHGRLALVTYMNGKSMSITYDNFDRVVSMTDFAGVTTAYTYDASANGVPDNIASISNKYGEVRFTYYTKADNVFFGDGKTIKEVKYSNGVTISYEYSFKADKAPQLISVETLGNSNALISGSYYTYDEKERVESLTQKSDVNSNDSNSNNTRYFTYNDMNQLIKEDVYNSQGVLVTSTSYTFDLKGNIVKRVISDRCGVIKSSNEYEYNPINQLTKLTEDGMKVKTFKYDSNGNMTDIISDNVILKHFKYNTLNQLVEYSDDQGSDVCYEYNAESLRKCKYYASDRNRKINYYYSQDGDIINEDGNTGLMTSYLIAGGRTLRAVGDKVEWYIKNGKDVVATLDNAQKNTNIYNYNAYGEDINLNNPSTATGHQPITTNHFDINDNPYKYSGYYLDEESGMYYCQARYYSPELMRFISRDTYDLSNRYAYCDGDPISNVDPNGHMPEFSQVAFYAVSAITIAASLIGAAFTGGASLAIAGITAGIDAASLGLQMAADATGNNLFLAGSLALGAVSMLVPTGVGMSMAGVAAKLARSGGKAEQAAARGARTVPKKLGMRLSAREASFQEGMISDLKKAPSENIDILAMDKEVLRRDMSRADYYVGTQQSKFTAISGGGVSEEARDGFMTATQDCAAYMHQGSLAKSSEMEVPWYIEQRTNGMCKGKEKLSWTYVDLGENQHLVRGCMFKPLFNNTGEEVGCSIQTVEARLDCANNTYIAIATFKGYLR